MSTITLKNTNGFDAGIIEYTEVQEFLTKYLKQRTSNPTSSSYGYDLYIYHPMYEFCNAKGLNQGGTNVEFYFRQVSPFFFEAAWQLCQRGILRNGVTGYQKQVTDEGSGGMGFSLTLFGKKWLVEGDDNDFFPTDLTNYGRIISEFSDLFGTGFTQRANEALRCYLSHAHFACCSMAGAAAESIALYLAIQIEGDEAKVVEKYEKPGGRTEILKIIGQKQTPKNLRQLTAYFELLSYWRDSSSHATSLPIDSDEAYTSILLLIKFAMFVRDHKDELTVT